MWIIGAPGAHCSCWFGVGGESGKRRQKENGKIWLQNHALWFSFALKMNALSPWSVSHTWCHCCHSAANGFSPPHNKDFKTDYVTGFFRVNWNSLLFVTFLGLWYMQRCGYSFICVEEGAQQDLQTITEKRGTSI